MRNRSLFVLSILLLLVTGSALAGERPSLGVSEFRNDTSASWWYGGAGNDLAAMLTNELAAMDKFKIVERAKLDAVLDEQDLADSGRISKTSGAKIGKLTGAKYLVFATVSAFETDVKGTGGGLSFRGISVGGKKEDAYLAVDLRVVDTTTGEVAFSKTIEGRASSSGMSLGVYRGGFGGNLGKYEKTPTGKAIRGAVVHIAEYLGCVIVDKDGCEAEFKQQDASRREKTKKSIKLD
jgi:curli biogenesis system outer membrane secretion channel CsgG